MKQILHTLTKLLYMGLNDCAWKITRISIENQCRIIAYFEPKKRRCLACSKCGTLARHQCLSVREHLALHQILLIGAVRLYVCVRQPLVHCSHCGCRGVCYPNWLKADKRYTEPFKAFIFWLCRTMSCAAVGRLCHIDPKTVRAIDMKMLKETIPVADLSNTRRLLVDEKCIGKGRFVTIVLDADSHKCLYVGQGHKKETLERFLKALPEQVKRQIEAVAMDGSRAYRSAVKAQLPHAKICLDRFHLYQDMQRMLQLALDEIAQSEDGKSQRQVIRRIATLAGRDDEESQALLEELSETHKPNAELIALVKLFKSAWQHSHFHKAASHLQGFAKVAMRSKVNAVKKFGRRIAKEADYIAHAIVLKLTNGAIESFNRKIADLLRRGYGYKDPSYFFLKIRQLSDPMLSILDFSTKTP